MKHYSFHMPVVEMPMEANGPVVHRSPDFRDISALSEAEEHGGLAGRMVARLEKMGERDLYRKNLPREFVAGSVELKLGVAREFVEDGNCLVTFHYVCWKLPGSTSRVAYVPACNIKVIIEGAGEPGEWVRPAIERALAREGWAQDLYQLLQLGRLGPPKVETTEIHFNLLTAADKRQIEAQRAERKGSVLGDFVDELRPSDRFPCHGREDALLLAAQSLAARQPRGVLLTGPSGVGKTAFVHEIARQRASLGLHDLSIWATTGGRIVAGMAGFGEWQLRCVRMAKQAAKQRAIIYLGSLRELCQSGRSEHQNQSVAEALIEPIQKGGLTVIVESTEEELALIEKDYPQVVQLFDLVRLQPPSGDALSAMLAAAEKGFSEAAILQRLHNAVISLHRRFGAYAASPGREMRFLHLLRESHENRHPDEGDAIAFFQRQSGMPDFLLEADKPFAVEQAQDWFAQRVRGQEDAVHKVVDVITTLRAGLQREGKPIANLLFAGPTGVGKTQLARSLAEYLFGDEDRLLRIDMSEYHHPAAVRRLAGSAGQGAGILTGRVREQPFSIILFDEFEKAHPDFFDLLLQICGEGRLTDPSGRVASFASSVIILTSNLGAQKAAMGGSGFDHNPQTGAIDPAVFIEAIRAHLRPEIFNRLDHIIPFGPLPQTIIAEIASQELSVLNRRHGLRDRDLGLTFSAEVVERLADQGFDIRYGARPLKRAIARNVLVPVAEAVNTLGYGCRGDLDLAIDETGNLRCTPPTLDEATVSASRTAQEIITATRALRCDAQALSNCDQYDALTSELYFLNRAKKDRREYNDSRLKAILSLQQQVDTFTAEVLALEDRSLHEFFLTHSLPVQLNKEVTSKEAALMDLLVKLDAFDEKNPHEAVMAVYGRDPKVLDTIFQMQCEAIQALFPGHEAAVFALFLDAETKSDGSLDLDDLEPKSTRWEVRAKSHVLYKRFDSLVQWQTNSAAWINDKFFGLAVEVRQPYAFQMLRQQGGFVGHRRGKNRSYVDLQVTAGQFLSNIPTESGRFSHCHYPKVKTTKWDPACRYAIDEKQGRLHLLNGRWEQIIGKAILAQTTSNRGATLASILRTLRQHHLRQLLR